MTNAELIQAIKAEIERLKGICTAQIKANPGQTFPFVMEMTGYDKLLSFIDTLESEKPMNLGERIGSYNIVPYIDDKIAKLQDMWREEKVSFDWDDLKDMIEDIARHFAQWQKEQMMKEAVEGEVIVPIYEGNDAWSAEIKIPGRYVPEDKVRVIVCKKED